MVGSGREVESWWEVGGGRGGDGPGTCMGKSLGSRNKTEKALDEEQKHLDLEPNG